MPAPRAKQQRPWINTDYDVPLAGGFGMREDPNTGRRQVYIVRDIPEWGWEPQSKQWVNHWEEIDDHEHGEEPHLDEKGYGHKGDAHDEDGNAATDANLERQGVDRKSYDKLLKPHIEQARQKAEAGLAELPPDLDQRAYFARTRTVISFQDEQRFRLMANADYGAWRTLLFVAEIGVRDGEMGGR